MEKLKPYMVEFNEDGTMKPKGYLPDCAVEGENQQPIIVITHDECTFSANENFEYGINNDGYWDRAKLHQQVVNKALPIAEALYPGYSLLFLFDNATSHSVYAKNALQVRDMNKGVGGQQPQLRDGWFYHHGIQIDQPINFQDNNGQLIPKKIHKILEEQNLWPIRGLKLEYVKPKCFNCQLVAKCKICVRRHKCDLCKVPKEHSGSISCSQNRKCDAYALRKKHCQCVTKKYCTNCIGKKEKCVDCKDLPSKCIIDGNYSLSINEYFTNLLF